jgi:uncharacterized membrane protein
MQPTPTRAEFDRLAEFHSLGREGVEDMLALAAARPSRAESLQFLARCLVLAGLLSLASGLVFFVAANWSRIAVFGRFALVEIVLAACAALACWKPPPRILGRGALFLAFVATGALLALFGQTYQTGADVYELFLAWALLGLPLVALAQWGVTSAAWLLVLNIAFALFCGWPASGGLLWAIFGSPHFQASHMILIAGAIDLALWFVFEQWRVPAVPHWVRRLAITCAFSFMTWAGVLSLYGSNMPYSERPFDPLVFTGFAIASIGAVAYALRRREDVYPLALGMAAFIIVSIVWLTRVLHVKDEGMFFLLALWLIATSTIGGRVLMTLLRRWRAAEAA